MQRTFARPWTALERELEREIDAIAAQSGQEPIEGWQYEPDAAASPSGSSRSSGSP